MLVLKLEKSWYLMMIISIKSKIKHSQPHLAPQLFAARDCLSGPWGRQDWADTPLTRSQGYCLFFVPSLICTNVPSLLSLSHLQPPRLSWAEGWASYDFVFRAINLVVYFLLHSSKNDMMQFRKSLHFQNYKSYLKGK